MELQNFGPIAQSDLQLSSVATRSKNTLGLIIVIGAAALLIAGAGYYLAQAQRTAMLQHLQR